LVSLQSLSLPTSTSVALTILPSRLLKKEALVLRNPFHWEKGTMVAKSLNSPLLTETLPLPTVTTRSALYKTAAGRW